MQDSIHGDMVLEKDVQKYFACLKSDPHMSHKTGQWCGLSRKLMTGRLLTFGVPHAALGTAMITAPKGSSPEEWMHTTETASHPFSFSAALAQLTAEKDYIDHHGFRFQKWEENGKAGLIITHTDGRPIRTPMPDWKATLDDSGGTVLVFNDHIAPTIKTRMDDGSIENLVLDPSLSNERPLTLSQWHARQGCSRAIVVHADHTGVIRPTPTTDESRLRLSDLLLTSTDDASLAHTIDALLKNSDSYRSMVCSVMGCHDWSQNPFLRLPYTQKPGAPIAAAELKNSLDKDLEMLAPFVAFEDWREKHRQSSLSPITTPKISL